MTDVLLYETGNGGDVLVRGNDLAAVSGYENAPYLSMFGGSDWWGNYLTTGKYQSQTEAILLTTPLTSSGRLLIENAINADLAFLSDIEGTTWSVNTAITGPNRLEITITINGDTFSYVWNPDTLFLTYKVP
jgi:hypothetical protein